MARDGVSPDLVSVVNQRIDVLRALTEPRPKRDLVDSLDASRSTVNRAVRQLESLGLVTRDTEYRLTVAGELVLEAFEEFLDDFGAVVAVEGLLTALPDDAPMAMPMVRDADVHRSMEASPTAPVTTAIDHLDPATDIRLLIPRFTRPDAKAKLRERVVDDGVPTSFVLERALAEHLRTDGTDWLAAVAAAPNCELRVTEGLPYTLGVLRKRAGLHVGIVVYDRDGAVRGFIQNDTLRAYAWGEAVFRTAFERATPLAETEFLTE